MQPQPESTTPHPKPRQKHWMRLFLFLLMVFGAALLLWSWYYKVSPILLFQLATKNTSKVKKFNDRTNILLLGIGGTGHSGGNLTDSIVLASIDYQKPDVFMLHIPRDIWIPSLKDKINVAYEKGETADKGLILAKATAEEVTGIPIHYAVLINFNGFQKMIDVLGGIDVEVAQSFTDEDYPIAGKEDDLCDGDPQYRCRYETITFTKGTEHMNGERALKYVRSRHAAGDAGTDFSRGARQIAVINAFKDKVLSKESVNLQKLQDLQKTSRESINTDMSLSEILLIAQSAYQKDTNIRSYGLTQEDVKNNKKGLLINPPLWEYEGKWVLAPKHQGDDDYFAQIHKYVACVLENTSDCEKLID